MNNHRKPAWSCWYYWWLKMTHLTAPLMPLMEVPSWGRWSRGQDPMPREDTGRQTQDLNDHLPPPNMTQTAVLLGNLERRRRVLKERSLKEKQASLSKIIFKKIKEKFDYVLSFQSHLTYESLNHGYLMGKSLWCCLGPPSSSAQWMALTTEDTPKTLEWGFLH